jgi:hypothetical protein
MKKLIVLILSIILLVSLSACSVFKGSFSRKEINELDPSSLQLEQAQQTVALALEYYDQGGYEKSAELFLEAAGLYGVLSARDEERRSLIAAAKVQLKCSQRQPFLLTVARYKGLVDSLKMPSEEERFLIDLSDQMTGKPLTYPVMGEWQAIFKN